MLPDYSDILERAGPPNWWDQNGAPRYGPFNPCMVTVHNKEVCLYLIECQACKKQFKVVEVSPSELGVIMRLPKEELTDEAVADACKINILRLHYGDPPRHDCAGDTMNCIDLEILEFWSRYCYDHEWHRVPEKEVELEDEG